MGDRANVCVKEAGTPPVYLYTHWQGSELPETVAAALARGRGRWADAPYLARIVFCEMVKGCVLDETGYGISGAPGDNPQSRPVLVLDVDTRTAGVADPDTPDAPFRTVPFEEFVRNPRSLPWVIVPGTARR